jgi:site-specific DNA recombinase
VGIEVAIPHLSPAWWWVSGEPAKDRLSHPLTHARRDFADVLAAARAALDADREGEPQRAFYGSQFGMTFPAFVHYGVGLWVPEFGGAIDPGSDAHDLVTALCGGMSKGERNRIKVRVRASMKAQTELDGRFLAGRPPYGYRLADAGPHPNPGKPPKANGSTRSNPTRSPPRPWNGSSPSMSAAGGATSIARGLTQDGIPCPSTHDRAPNPHRNTQVWETTAVRAILQNPRYTGRQVWNRARTDEVLIDVEDVALGHEKPAPLERPEPMGLVTHRVSHAADKHGSLRARPADDQGARYPRRSGRTPRHSGRPYLFRGRITCGLYDRSMVGNPNHGRLYYRCTATRDFVRLHQISHPPALDLLRTPSPPRSTGSSATN